MRKSFLFLFTTILITSSYGQSYKEPLEKLNTYLVTFDNGSYGHIEVREGYFYLINKYGGYDKAKIEDLNSATKSDKFDGFVTINCKTGDCVLHSHSSLNSAGMSFRSDIKFNVPHLITLLNDFIYSYKNGNVPVRIKFTGTVKDGKKWGQGQYYLADETIIEGNFENDELVGKGKIMYNTGDVYIGDIKDYKASGEGTLTYKTHGEYKQGGTYKGSFLNDLPNGKGESNIVSKDLDYSIKTVTYEGNWKDGLEDGFGEFKQVNVSHSPNIKRKRTYKGNWKNGLKDGYGVYTDDLLNQSYDGNWKNGLRDGYGVFSHSRKSNVKSKFDGEWSKDKHVKGKYYDLNGKFYFEGTEEAMLIYKRSNSVPSTEPVKNTPSTDCVCSFCSGTGTLRIKSIQVYYPDVVKDGRVVGKSSTSQTRTIYEDLTCTRCLGTGKCK